MYEQHPCQKKKQTTKPKSSQWFLMNVLYCMYCTSKKTCIISRDKKNKDGGNQKSNQKRIQLEHKLR